MVGKYKDRFELFSHRIFISSRPIQHFDPMAFFFRSDKSTKTVETSDVGTTCVMPQPDDHAALKEIEIQRFKWNEFLKRRPKAWSEDWLWQNWNTGAKKKPRPIQKKFLQVFSPKAKAQRKIKKLIRGGVPPEFRGSVWWACSGAESKMTAASKSEQFYALVMRADELTDTQVAADIEKDLLRTFPDRMQGANQGMIDSLRRVLLAYALRNPTVGYCQSMNFICALILFHLSEEHTFWVLAVLIEDFLPPNYYAPTLLGGRVDQQVFQSCIAWKLPKIFEAFKETNTLLEPIICPWFLCLFINVLPLYTVCRVWDCMFWEGNEVLFRIGLTLVKSKTRQIMQATDFIGVYLIFKNSTTSSRDYNSYSFELEKPPEGASASSTGHHISDTEFMVHSAFGYRWLRSVPRANICTLREKFLALLDAASHARSTERMSVDAGGSPSKSASGGSTPKNGKKSGDFERLKRTRKSVIMLKALEETSLDELHQLAKELDEGLHSHVVEFARELKTESSDCTEDGREYSDSVAAYLDDDDEDEDEDEEDGSPGGRYGGDGDDDDEV